MPSAWASSTIARTSSRVWFLQELLSPVESTPPPVVILMPSAPARAQVRTSCRHCQGPSAVGGRVCTDAGTKRSQCPAVMPTTPWTSTRGPVRTRLAKILPIAIWASSPARSRKVVTPRRRAALRVRDSVQHLFLPGCRQGPGGEVDGACPRIADEVNVGVDEPGDHRQVVPTGGRRAHHFGDGVVAPGHPHGAELGDAVPGGNSVQLHARRQ